MSKETKNSMAVRQHMEAAANAADAYYRADDENRAVIQILIERKNEEDPGSAACSLMGYGKLLTLGIDNAIDNCEGFKNALIVALGMRSPLLGILLTKVLNSSEEESEE